MAIAWKPRLCRNIICTFVWKALTIIRHSAIHNADHNSQRRKTHGPHQGNQARTQRIVHLLAPRCCNNSYGTPPHVFVKGDHGLLQTGASPLNPYPIIRESCKTAPARMYTSADRVCRAGSAWNCTVLWMVSLKALSRTHKTV